MEMVPWGSFERIGLRIVASPGKALGAASKPDCNSLRLIRPTPLYSEKLLTAARVAGEIGPHLTMNFQKPPDMSDSGLMT